MITKPEFTDIYNRLSNKVYRLCLGYASGDEDLAKEWTQRTFIQTWNHRTSYKGKASVDTWIYRIAVNTCLSDLRARKKELLVNTIAHFEIEQEDESNEIEMKIKKMHSCINKLNAQNKALILFELENIPQATIAETVGISHNSVRTRLSRIRKLLLKCIKNEK